MKRTILAGIALALSTTAFTQTKDTGALPVKSGNEWQMPREVLTRARSFSTHVQRSLTLDSVTTQKLFELYLGNTKSVDEIRVGSASKKDKQAALAANQQEFDQKVKPLLTQDQFAKYLRDRKAGKY